MKTKIVSAYFVLVFLFSTVMIIFSFKQPEPAQAAPPVCSDVFFSEYIEGSVYNKALEIFNGTSSSIDLEAEGYKVQYYQNGSSTPSYTDTLSGVLAPGDVFVIADNDSDAAILAQADLTPSHSFFNGDDTIVLLKGNTVVDVFGRVGEDPGSYWGSGSNTTKDHTLRRKSSVNEGDTDTSDAFDPADEWDSYDQDNSDNLGSHSATCYITDDPPSVSNTTPADGATDIALETNITITFSEAVTATGSWYDISCSTSGSHAATASGGPTTFTLDPTTDFTVSETCTTTVYASQITDQDGTADNMSSDYVFSFDTLPVVFGSCGDNNETRIHTIQGSGASSSMTGEIVVIEGIVVGDYQNTNQLSGFFLQEESVDEDGNPATSEGIFVYYYNLDVNVGDVVRVQGEVEEHNGLTEITYVTNAQICPSVSESIAVPTVTLPLTSTATLEKYEGMKVSFPQKLYATENFNLGRYGQFWMSSADRLWQPTHATTPGANAIAQKEANNLNRVLVDDASNQQNPDPIAFPPPELTYTNTLRSGDTVTGMQAVIGYGYSNYMLYPTSYTIVEDNPRSATPPDVGGSFKVASFNVLNYFNGDGQGGGFPAARGADTLEEFNRQRDKIINAILDLHADVIGIMEIENDGYDQYSAIQDLVNGLNASAPVSTTYAFIDPGVTQIGDDEIAVGIIYRVETANPVGDAEILDDTYDTSYYDDYNRPALAQTFEQISTNERFTVVVNHLKSKGSDCEAIGDYDQHDGQGECNATRTSAATVETAWLATDPTGSSDNDFLVIGDLNAYRNEDPINAFATASYTDLLRIHVGDGAYSYVFKGEWGYLDYALANSSLLPQVTGANTWHINADEPRALDYNTEYKNNDQLTTLYGDGPFRSSDHDPVLVGLFDYDFSDLPSSYGIAYHKGGGSLRLGSLWDALGDTSNGADNATDDGVSIVTVPWQPNLQASLAVTTSAAGYLAAWIDWDNNGTFDADELIISQTLTTSGVHTLSYTIGADYDPSSNQDYNARFRFYASQPSTLSATGAADAGEVEDYTFHFAPSTYTIYLPITAKGYNP